MGSITARATEILNGAWDPLRGYCYPNPDTYPHLWLWDSCFHAIAWSALRDERALRELHAVFSAQFSNGFVPHMTYSRTTDVYRGPHEHASSYTQPPLYAHAARAIIQRGLPVSNSLIMHIEEGLDSLWRLRRKPDGLIYIVHPWEGADDSPRFDDWLTQASWNREAWNDFDHACVGTTTFNENQQGVASANSTFEVAPAAFNCLTVHAMDELHHVTGKRRWAERADSLAESVDSILWNSDTGLWSDYAYVGGNDKSVHAATLDGVLGALCTRDRVKAERALSDAADPEQFRGQWGLRFVSKRDASYSEADYWRGSCWIQMNYLVWLACNRWGEASLGTWIAEISREAAIRSGFAEHYHPSTAEGLGAQPQTWSTLVMAFDG